MEGQDQTDAGCKTEDAVVALLRVRGRVGRLTYNASMDRSDLTPSQWIQHFQEEMGDGLQYAERVKGACKLLEEAVPMIEALATMGWETASEWLTSFNLQFGKVERPKRCPHVAGAPPTIIAPGTRIETSDIIPAHPTPHGRATDCFVERDEGGDHVLINYGVYNDTAWVRRSSIVIPEQQPEKDPYTKIAALAFGKSAESVTPEERKAAKQIAFAVRYGKIPEQLPPLPNDP